MFIPAIVNIIYFYVVVVKLNQTTFSATLIMFSGEIHKFRIRKTKIILIKLVPLRFIVKPFLQVQF